MIDDIHVKRDIMHNGWLNIRILIESMDPLLSVMMISSPLHTGGTLEMSVEKK